MHGFICILLLQKSDFKVIGVLIAMSLMQGGPGFPVLSPHVYEYMSTQQYLDLNIKDDDIPDPLVRLLLTQVE